MSSVEGNFREDEALLIKQAVLATKHLDELINSKERKAIEYQDIENCACECELVLRDLASMRLASKEKQSIDKLSVEMTTTIQQASWLANYLWKPQARA